MSTHDTEDFTQQVDLTANEQRRPRGRPRGRGGRSTRGGRGTTTGNWTISRQERLDRQEARRERMVEETARRLGIRRDRYSSDEYSSDDEETETERETNDRRNLHTEILNNEEMEENRQTNRGVTDLQRGPGQSQNQSQDHSQGIEHEHSHYNGDQNEGRSYQPHRYRSERRRSRSRSRSETNRPHFNFVQQQTRVPNYDGTTCYSLYKMQFDIIAEDNNWNQQQKRSNLIRSIQGKAIGALEILRKQGKEITYDNLNTTLERMFTQTKSRWELKREFEDLKQKPEQTIRDFALEVEQAGRAFMTADKEEDVQEAMVTVFIKGMLDKRAAHGLTFTPSDTLENAIKHLNRRLDLQSALEPPTKRIRRMSTTGPVDDEPDDETFGAIVAALDTATSPNKTDEITQTTRGGRGGRGSRGGGRGSRGGRGGRGTSRGTYKNNDNRKGSLFCTYCNRPNHTIEYCYDRIEKEGGQIEKCFYCERPGHRVNECRTKAKDIANGTYREKNRNGNGNPGTSRGYTGPSNPFHSGGMPWMPNMPPDMYQAAMAWYRQGLDQNFQPNNNNKREERKALPPPEGTPSSSKIPYVPQQGN